MRRSVTASAVGRTATMAGPNIAIPSLPMALPVRYSPSSCGTEGKALTRALVPSGPIRFRWRLISVTGQVHCRGEQDLDPVVANVLVIEIYRCQRVSWCCRRR